MTEVFFYIFAATIIACALGVVLIRSIVYAALFLVGSLLGVAGIYMLLSVEFLARVQVLIYGGAVMVLILFALMLTKVPELQDKLDGDQKPLAAVTAIALFGTFFAAIYKTTWPRDIDQLTTVPFNDISDALFSTWMVPFELVSGVLLVALVGAIIISMQEDEVSR